MTFLPIVDRELRVRARSKSTYRLRVISATLSILVVTGMLLVNQVSLAPARVGLYLFQTLAWPAFFYCLLAGAWTTADCLSSEKRAGTLGLLFLTDLKGYDVVFGKLVASSLNPLYGLIGIFPALGVPLLLGGVTAGEFWRLVLALLVTLALSLSVGLWVSALVRDERRAWGGTVLMVALLSAGPPLLGLVSAFNTSWIAFSPWMGFTGSFDGAYGARPGAYWKAIGSMGVLSWWWLGGASLLVPRTWQDRPLVSRRLLGQRGWLGTLGAWAQPRQRALLLEENPVVWLAGRKLAVAHGAAWVLVVGVGLIALVSQIAMKGFGPLMATLAGVAVLLHCFLSAWAGWEACHLLGEAKASGALELILHTPLTGPQIVEGYRKALRRLFLGPVLSLVGLEVVIALGQIWFFEGRSFKTAEVFLGLGIGGFLVVLFLTDMYAAGMFGLWMGFTSKTRSAAFTRAFILGIFVPWVLSMCCWFFYGPFLLLVKNVILAGYARSSLIQHVRARVGHAETWREGARAARGGAETRN